MCIKSLILQPKIQLAQRQDTKHKNINEKKCTQYSQHLKNFGLYNDYY